MQTPEAITKIVRILPKTLTSIKLYGLSDLHIGTHYYDEKKVNEVIKEILENPNAYVLIGGDIVDNTLKNSVGSVYENKYTPREQKKMAVELLRPIAHKILAITPGNHEDRSAKEADSGILEDIAILLGLENLYAENAFVLFLKYGRPRKDSYCTTSIYMKHGSGGGSRVGSKANRLEDLKKEVIADIYITGHTHQQMIFPQKIVIADHVNCALIDKVLLFVNSGTFLNWGGYAVKKGFSPIVTGCPTIDLWYEYKNGRVVKHMKGSIIV